MDDVRSKLVKFLDIAGLNLAAANEPQTAESLAEAAVELFTKELADPTTRSEIVSTLTPFVQNWLDGKIDVE